MTTLNVYGETEASFTVPAENDPETHIKSGTTRMRIQLQESAAQPYNPCATFGYGATKDYTITIVAPSSGGGVGGVSGGGVFLILLTVVGVLYVVGGCVFMRTRRGTTGLKESCPNNQFWFALPGLVMDGMRYTKVKCLGLCGKGGGYDNMNDL